MTARVVTSTALLLISLSLSCSESTVEPPPDIAEVFIEEKVDVQIGTGEPTAGKVVSCADGTEDHLQLCRFLLQGGGIREEDEDFQYFVRTLELTTADFDLNGDERPEMIAWASSWARSGGGALWILKRVNDGFELVGSTEMAWSPIIVLPRGPNGWRDISYLQAGGGSETKFIRFRYSKGSYRVGTGRDIQPSEGITVVGRRWQPSYFGPLPSVESENQKPAAAQIE